MIPEGEFGLIERIRSRFETPAGITGIGDDCAVIPQNSGEDTLVSTDMLVEGVHFLLEGISPWQLGWKSAAVNISDIAAMGGSPVGSFLSFALPRDISPQWIDGFLDGYGSISREYGVPLLGGDTTASESGLCISVTVMGKCPAGQGRRRNAAKVGDMICVTGPLGDSAAGLRAILSGDTASDIAQLLVKRHCQPIPRVKEGLSLAGCGGVHAMMDISDGIGSDLRHILDESGVGAEVDVQAVPLSDELRTFCTERGLDALELAISGGEDYELLFTAEEGCNPGIPFYRIGRITGESGIIWKGGDRDYNGFRHF